MSQRQSSFVPLITSAGKCGLPILLAAIMCCSLLEGEQMRHITIADCVSTRRFVSQEIHVSPDGTQVAYIVKSPDIHTNTNRYQLYLRNLRQLTRREEGRLILEGESLSGLRWLKADELMFKIGTREQQSKELRSEVKILHLRTGAQERLSIENNIVDYSSSADGNIVVYSASVAHDVSPTDVADNKRRQTLGYRVPYGARSGNASKDDNRFALYLLDRASGKRPKRLSFQEQDSNATVSWLRNVRNLNLSPNGKYLLFCYATEKVPSDWENQPLIKQLREIASPGASVVMGFYDIDSGRLRLAINQTSIFCQTRWSGDSQAYSVVGPSPFGTAEGDKEQASAVAFGSVYFYLYRFNHVFVVDVKTGKCTLALRRDTGEPGNPIFAYDVPLVWKKHDGEMIVRADAQGFVRMIGTNGEWKQLGRIEPGRLLSSTSSDGKVLIGVAQAPMVPPDLFLLNLQTNDTALLTDMNPAYRHIYLGHVETIEWTNRYGSKAIGHLITPVGYETGKRYPLVFLGTDSGEEFISDAYPGTMSYPPQMLADAGFMVLMCHYPRDNKISANRFAGDMSAAFNWMAMVEGAVDLLSNRGMVDRDNVGLAGFSRTSWLTNFTITHSTYKFTAASSADSALYTYTQYYKYNILSQIKGDESQVGGPPQGDTFTNWLEYSPPFKADRVQAAVLLEFTSPIEDAYELFIALAREGKPVELYYYPKGSHPLDTPLERVASLQRNVDWFRFWMQSYERKNPEDPDQYTRWRAMRAQNETKINGGSPLAK